MNRSRRSNRLNLRSGLRRLFGRGAEAASEAAALARSAGQIPETNFEALEGRQLLFTLTIDPGSVNPVTGIGTAQAYFAYFIPYLTAVDEIQIAEPEDKTEDFNQAQPGPPPALVGQNFTFQSDLQIVHNLTQLLLVEPAQGDNELQASMGPNQQITFRDARGLPPISEMSLDLIGPGFNPNDITVELLDRDGEVLETFTGQALEDRRIGGSRFAFALTSGSSFSQLRIVKSGSAPSSIFRIDDVAWTVPDQPYRGILGSRIFGVSLTFSGPANATVQVLDLYGQEMRQTIAIGQPQGAEVIIADPEGDGIPNYNDGIGRIIMSGVNARSALTLIGGTIISPPVAGVDFAQGVFGFVMVDSILGFYDDFEDAGFGFQITTPPGGQPTVTGLPPGPGSLIIGSPFVRPQNNYNPAGAAPGGAPVLSGFSRADQGIFVNGGASIGSVYVHGMVFGTSNYTGAVGRIIHGTTYGSINVNGDLGSFVNGGDAGIWTNDDGAVIVGAGGRFSIQTNGQLNVGRTIGEVMIAGRSLMNTTVVGDLGRPSLYPPQDIFRYNEKEFSSNLFGANITQQTLMRAIRNANGTLGQNEIFAELGIFFGRVDQSLVFGDGFSRNDTLMSAEWIGSAATAVQINGELGRQDIVNTAEDPSDVYAFAVDGTTEVTVQVSSGLLAQFLGAYMRLVDADGRTVAAPQIAQRFQDFVVLRYKPNAPGVLYLVVQTPGAGTAMPDIQYVLTVSGMAPTTLGAYRTGSGFGDGRFPISNTLTVLSGSVGSIRVGTAYVNGGGGETEPEEVYNPEEGVELEMAMSLRRSTISIPGHLYNITTGSDIKQGPVTITVGGNLGTLITGQSDVIGLGSDNGDLRFLNLTVGGAIGMIDVRGGLGVDQDAEGEPKPVDPASTIVVRTGTNSTLRGDIGMFRVGWHAGTDTLSLQVGPNAKVGGLLISQDVPDDTGPNIGIYGPGGVGNGLGLNLGFNSDLRFFDTPQIDLLNVQNQFIALTPNVPVTLTDDGGGQVEIMIVDGAAVPASVGLVRVIPVNSSLGVAIGRIEVDLTGGARLRLRSLGPVGSQSVISIGRIIVTGADNNASIGIEGNAEIDVWKIEGADLLEVVNLTPRGDIVAIDQNTISTVRILSGNLGKTQVPAWGPQRIGPFIGIGAEGGIPVPANAMTPFWNGQAYRPVNNSNSGVSFIDDVGSPVDPYLNGVLAREGDIVTVEVGGAVGDVMAPAGNIISVTANFDRVKNIPGQFEGLIGNIYANRISRVDIGDGQAMRDDSPISTTGIFANDDILLVIGDRINGANISSSIMAANNVVGNTDPNNFVTDGIDRVDLRGGGSYIDAYIGSEDLDGFWSSFFGPDSSVYAGAVRQVTGTGANFFRSQVTAASLQLLQLNGGYYDASTVRVAGDVARIEAVGFRNSTVEGGELEFTANQILVAGNLGILTTFSRAGDIEDLTVDVLGRINEVSAHNISRTRVDADIEISQIVTMGSLRGSSITTGSLVFGDFRRNVSSSDIRVAGPLQRMLVGDGVYNTLVSVSGPDGRIDNITARLIFSGTINAAGPIDTIEVTQGDLVALIQTAANQRGIPGNVKLLKAARDLDIRTDISGTVDRMVAGRHIGNIANPGVILVRGAVTLVDASNGQLYSDLRIGQNLVEARIGAVANKPGNSAQGFGSIITFGRIETITIGGDFGGSISSASGGIGVITINNGSLLPTGSITALDGNLNNIVINNGHLLGNVHADYILFSIRLNGSEDGVFGDIGINPALSSGVFYDALRNQLPPGVAANANIQGPRITAGHNIGRIVLTNGSMFEVFIHAGRAIGTIDVNGSITKDSFTPGQASVIAAGSTIFTILASGNIEFTDILVGIRDFGQDGRPGGVGVNADTVQSGRITTIHANGSGTNVRVAAGMNAGADGEYNTFDETVVLGISYVRSVTFGGAASNVSVFADSPTLDVSPGVTRAGTGLPIDDPDLSDGGAVGVQLTPGDAFAFTWAGVNGTILFTGPGRAYWDQATGRVVLVNVGLNNTLVVDAGGATLPNFKIVTNDDASMGPITVNANLSGDWRIVIDAYSLGVQTGHLSGTGTLRVGMNIRSIVVGAFTGGSIQAAYWAREITIGGDYGTPDTFDEVRLSVLAGQIITIAGRNSGLINAHRDLGSLVVGGALDGAQFRSGASLGSLTAASSRNTRISVADNIGPVVFTGNVEATQIMAGGDLGEDVLPGGTGFNADRATTGSIASLTVGGNFIASDAVAGLLRGPDGYFGTSDDTVAPGRSNIGPVTIAGTQTGSSVFTQQFRISATGTVGAVTIGGQAPSNEGNFRVGAIPTEPTPIRVVDLRVVQEGNTWYATLTFNQPMESSTIGPALSIAEVRNNGGQTLLPLVEGVDYTLETYNVVENSIRIIFSRDITERNLIPQGGPPAAGSFTPGELDPNLPGPGVYRFELEADILRAAVANARLDGDANGFALTSENYSQDDFVGDAGDKYSPEVINAGELGFDHIVDMYGPVDLDEVLDNNLTPDGLPDPNRVHTIRGSIGDHPDNDLNFFRFGGDTDIYKVTLQAGQILRLGAMSGPAQLAGRALYNANGESQGGVTADSVELPTDFTTVFNETLPSAYLIKTTGVYYIVVGNSGFFDVPGFVPNLEPLAGDTGRYDFTVEVFDDGDSGFAAGTNSGNGAAIVDAPAPIVFAGPNGVFQDPSDPTNDDLTQVAIGDFRFTLDPGPDGIRGTADDIVSGSNGTGITSTRQGNSLSTVINSAIGPRGHTGVPGDIAADVDVYHLNNGQPIAPGRLITVTIKLAELGADLGSFSSVTLQDLRGFSQFGIFDTTGATAVDDGLLVFSPTDFKPRAGAPGEIANNGVMSYGYDANGDFYITFITPDRIGGIPGEAGTFALYIQGAFNTDYSIQVTQTDGQQPVAIPQTKQNVFIETQGGVINWLEAGGLTTELKAFASSVLGFTGTVGGQQVDQYIINNTVARVQAIFNATGLNVVVSNNPSLFEFQPFSTVYVTATSDPTTIFNTNNFGYSQHSDPYNLDKNDDAVLFLPSFATLGYTPNQASVDQFVLSLAAAVARRAGELMGLRITQNVFFANPIDVMAANSVSNVPGGGNSYAITDVARALSTGVDSVTDTNFFLGRQQAFSLLNKFLLP